jgi:hypothetical protein
MSKSKSKVNKLIQKVKAILKTKKAKKKSYVKARARKKKLFNLN